MSTYNCLPDIVYIWSVQLVPAFAASQHLPLIFHKFCTWKIDFWVPKNISRLAYGHPRISSYLGMSLMYLERPLAAQILLIPTEKGLKIQQIATK